MSIEFWFMLAQIVLKTLKNQKCSQLEEIRLRNLLRQLRLKLPKSEEKQTSFKTEHLKIEKFIGHFKKMFLLYNRKNRSNWWFLLPIFMGLIGGVIAFFVLRNDDPGKAKNCLYLGLVLFALGVVLNLALFGLEIPPIENGFDVNV